MFVKTLLQDKKSVNYRFTSKKSKSVKKTTFKASTFHHVFRIFPSLSIKERSIFEVRSWILSYYKFLHMIEGAWPCHRVEETATARRHRALSGYNQNWINNKFLKLYLPYARHYNPLLIRNCSWILTIHKARILWKNSVKNVFYLQKMGWKNTNRGL